MRMLWVIWLRAGPTIELMRKYLLSVRVMVSDMGVEIGIPDVVDHLPAFFDWIQGKDLTSKRSQFTIQPRQGDILGRGLWLATCCRIEATQMGLPQNGVQVMRLG